MVRFDPWYGEFGWEVMTWIPYLRNLADRQRGIATSFKGMDTLYKDFADFESHNETGRSLTFPKRYRVKGKYVKYGTPEHRNDVLIHARGIRRSSFKNYRRWQDIDLNASWIGSETDQCHGDDLRGIPLEQLVNYIAGAKVVIGQSSGVMHLAMLCGTPVIVWGDERTYFGERLEKRYKETWNPLKSEVTWITCTNWQPEPKEIINVCRGYV